MKVISKVEGVFKNFRLFKNKEYKAEEKVNGFLLKLKYLNKKQKLLVPKNWIKL